MAAALLSSSALGQEDGPITTPAEQPSAQGPLVFEAAAEKFGDGGTKLVNGSADLDTKAWQALLIARRDNGKYCTATLIGPRVLLTAAHCLDAGFGDKAATVGGHVSVNGTPFRLVGCEMHEGYAAIDRGRFDLPRSSEDYGLCELDADPGIPAETIVREPLLGPASEMLLTGYGCTGIRVALGALAFDRADLAGAERLRMGDVRIDAVGVADHGAAKGHYLRTRSVQAEPILCPGDSGGPAIAGASLAQQRGPLRRVVGVNSMVSAVRRGERYEFLSFVSSVGTPSFQDFLVKWAAKAPATRRVCGKDLQPGEAGCRT